MQFLVEYSTTKNTNSAGAGARLSATREHVSLEKETGNGNKLESSRLNQVSRYEKIGTLKEENKHIRRRNRGSF
jgi:hypothetical protein